MNKNQKSLCIFFCVIILICISGKLYAETRKWCSKCGHEYPLNYKFCPEGHGALITQIKIPNVIDKNIIDAKTRLQSDGFIVKIDTITGEVSGKVITQNPKAGTWRNEGSLVTITISISSPKAKWVERMKNNWEGWPVPGKGVAGIFIGDTSLKVIEAIGEPTIYDSVLNRMIWDDKNRNILEINFKNNKVFSFYVVMNDSLRRKMKRVFWDNVLKDVFVSKYGLNEYFESGISYFMDTDSSIINFRIYPAKKTSKFIKFLKDMKTDFLKRNGCLSLTPDSIKKLCGEPEIEQSDYLKYSFDNNTLIFSLVGGEVDTITISVSPDLLDTMSIPKIFSDFQLRYGKPSLEINNNKIYNDEGYTITIKNTGEISEIKLYHSPYENMVLIPAGFFLLGTSMRDIKEMNDSLKVRKFDIRISKNDIYDELYYKVIWLDSFYIDKYEITNKQFKKFVNATNYKSLNWEKYYKPGQDNYPVRGITWDDANAYAKWAGKQLPTEFQWERAAKGDGNYWFPWGNDFNAQNRANYNKTGDLTQTQVSAVDAYPKGKSVFGLYNMAGNVWEWCRNIYIDIDNYYNMIPQRNPQGTASEVGLSGSFGTMSVRGGSFKSFIFDLRCANRYYLNKTESRDDVGFRCVKEIKYK